jgi:hypothetical protein
METIKKVSGRREYGYKNHPWRTGYFLNVAQERDVATFSVSRVIEKLVGHGRQVKNVILICLILISASCACFGCNAAMMSKNASTFLVDNTIASAFNVPFHSYAYTTDLFLVKDARCFLFAKIATAE